MQIYKNSQRMQIKIHSFTRRAMGNLQNLCSRYASLNMKSLSTTRNAYLVNVEKSVMYYMFFDAG